MGVAVPYRVDRRYVNLQPSHWKTASSNKMNLAVPRFFSTEAGKPGTASIAEGKAPEDDLSEVSHDIRLFGHHILRYIVHHSYIVIFHFVTGSPTKFS